MYRIAPLATTPFQVPAIFGLSRAFVLLRTIFQSRKPVESGVLRSRSQTIFCLAAAESGGSGAVKLVLINAVNET